MRSREGIRNRKLVSQQRSEEVFQETVEMKDWLTFDLAFEDSKIGYDNFRSRYLKERDIGGRRTEYFDWWKKKIL